ncbi:mucin-5AC-like [Archocentrus centrarchus]|uniref:mucin-5AC-like n=1 Tax=Archocentrus centrarchus TaxID=63155 RepID=UPI0011EA26EE|nr:mucin-5AC-like [Archocentrus centrarchus]XP_030586354.1 mucin-5AC-like [Archocentrus centrarchus]
MAMDVSFTILACCLLALSFNVAQTKNGTSTPPTTSSLTMKEVITTPTSSNSTSPVTIISNLTEETTQYNSTKLDNQTFVNTTAATTESTSNHQTSQSATTLTPLIDSTLLKTTSNTQMPTFTASTTATIQTTVGHLSTAGTPVITSENSSHAVITTSDSVNRTTQGVVLNMSERSMTIVFSTVLGALSVLLAFFMFHKCKQKIQYLHQPLNNADYTDAFVADDDTLVISGGLYDGHPIYDNVPTAPADQSQLRLEFLH